ncbi:MAG: acyl-CoA thioesterase [Calditrichaeota bacterium]|nr:MAG: acyl-CoA thioesterase [Calditrichota bacterium]
MLIRNSSRMNTEGFFMDAKAEISEIVLPTDANILGNILGGKVMHLIDIACAIAAFRHCRKPCVTASIDFLDFKHPIKVGELITIKASLNRAFTTSMEIGARVFSENLYTGEIKHTSSAYLTFVALDKEKMKPVAVKKYIPETDNEIRRWKQAEIRRKHRLAGTKKLSGIK